MYVIAHQGGGFKGAFGVPILETLVKERRPDLILGVSVGAINGVLAAQNDFNLLREIWEDIDDGSPLDGIKGFLRPAVLRGKALFHLEPIRKKLQRHVSLSKLVTPFGCGAVARETDEYINFMSSRMKRDARLHDAVLASSAIAGIMEPIVMPFRGRDLTWSDGGHLHSIPLLPDELTSKVQQVDIILTSPIKQAPKRTDEVNGLLESLEWALHIQSIDIQRRGLRRYRALTLSQDTVVRVFSPPQSLGGMLKADKETIRWRMHLGKRALDKPTIWEPAN